MFFVLWDHRKNRKEECGMAINVEAVTVLIIFDVCALVYVLLYERRR